MSKRTALPRALWLRMRRAWDRLSTYLPLLFMALMAMTTYWLVRNTPTMGEAALEKAPRHVPDYFMRDFSVRTFNTDGSLKSEMLGAQGRHYPDTDTLEIEQPHMRIFGAQGRLTTATAARGLINADGSEVQLFDNAVVVREVAPSSTPSAQPARSELRSDFLHVFANTEQVRSHRPVVLLRGDGDRFAADSLDYDNLDQVIRLKGRVRGIMQPPEK